MVNEERGPRNRRFYCLGPHPHPSRILFHTLLPSISCSCSFSNKGGWLAFALLHPPHHHGWTAPVEPAKASSPPTQTLAPPTLAVTGRCLVLPVARESREPRNRNNEKKKKKKRPASTPPSGMVWPCGWAPVINSVCGLPLPWNVPLEAGPSGYALAGQVPFLHLKSSTSTGLFFSFSSHLQCFFPSSVLFSSFFLSFCTPLAAKTRPSHLKHTHNSLEHNWTAGDDDRVCL